MFSFESFAGNVSPEFDLTTCVGNEAENCSTRILIKAAQSFADEVRGSSNKLERERAKRRRERVRDVEVISTVTLKVEHLARFLSAKRFAFAASLIG